MPRVLPTRSSSNNLTLVRHSGAAFYPNSPVITLSQDLNSHTVIHTLEIKTSVFAQEPQIYELPSMHEKSITVNLLWGDRLNSDFTIVYDDAKQLRENGLLIYLAHFDEFYIYFVSGKSVICYSRSRDSDEWIINLNPPRRRVRAPDYSESGFVVIRSDWVSNYWVTTEHVHP